MIYKKYFDCQLKRFNLCILRPVPVQRLQAELLHLSIDVLLQLCVWKDRDVYKGYAMHDSSGEERERVGDSGE